jgi:hypothetical protein
VKGVGGGRALAPRQRVGATVPGEGVVVTVEEGVVVTVEAAARYHSGCAGVFHARAFLLP